MGRDLEGIGLRALRSSDRIWTDKEVTVEDGEIVRTYLNEFVDYYGGDENGSVQRRWVLTATAKNSGKIMSTYTITDRQVFEFFPEADIELPEPPEDVGKNRADLVLDDINPDNSSESTGSDRNTLVE